jgi:carbon storage regulator
VGGQHKGGQNRQVLSRKVGERILIGDRISVTVVRSAHGVVRIGIEAPPEMLVVREELKDQLTVASKATQLAARSKPR